MLDRLSEFFTLALRYRRAGESNPLVRKVVIKEMHTLHERSPQRLRFSIDRFFREVGETATTGATGT